MTDANNSNQEIYTLLAELARKQLQTETNLQGTQEKIDRTQEQIERTQEQIERTQEQLERTQIQVDQTQRQLSATQFEVETLTNDINRVFTRNEILNNVLLELRDSHEEQQEILTIHQRLFEQNQISFEQHQRNFEENQRATNAALDRLEAILMRLIRDSN
jgi:prophage DNA circulation protein